MSGVTNAAPRRLSIIMVAHALKLSDRDFVPDVLEADVPVLVDFWSFWCAPCQHRAGVIDRIATEYAGLVRVRRIDIDDYHRIAAAFEVHSLPSLLLFDRGREVARRTGVVSARAVRELLDAHLPPKAEWPLQRRALA